jgi:WD40 repeat protein
MSKIRFTAGGTVQAGNGMYLERAADAELLRLCRDRQFTYILTSRQMGKSSALEHAAQCLAAEGYARAVVDLTGIGVNIPADQWYLGVLAEIEQQLALKTGSCAWWKEHSHLGYTQRLVHYLQRVALAELRDPLIVFIDEIDTTLSLPFADDFFAAIRYLYNARAGFPELSRLSFVLVGTASPSDLIQDPLRTPFNIGHAVELSDFSYSEILPLAQGFDTSEAEAQPFLKAIYGWTGGHPYLTQRLCLAVATAPLAGDPAALVRRIATETFFPEGIGNDTNLRYVRDMLVRKHRIGGDIDPVDVLRCYRDVCLGTRVADEERSPAKNRLKLSGIVSARDGFLATRNAIYERTFDLDWVDEQLALQQESLARQVEVAERQRKQAERATEVALARQLVLQAEAEREERAAGLERSLVLAIESLRLQPSVEAERSLRGALHMLARPVRRFALGSAITAMRFSADGETLLAGTSQSGVHFCDFRQGAARRLGREEGIAALVMTRDGSQAVVAASTGRVAVYRIPEFRHVVSLPELHSIGAVEISSDSRWLAVAHGFNQVSVFDMATAALTTTLSHLDRVLSIAFSPDGRWLATGGLDRAVRLWSTRGWKPVRAIETDSGVPFVEFSPYGRLLFFVSSSGTAMACEPGEIQMRQVWSHGGKVAGFDVSSNGKLVATAGEDGAVGIWRVESNQRVAQLKHSGAVHAVRFSRTNTHIGTAGADGTGRVWEVSRGAEIARICHDAPVTHIVANQAGSRWATGSADGVIQVFVPRAGAEVFSRACPGSHGGASAVSHSGLRMAVPAGVETVRVVNLSLGKELCRIKHNRIVTGVCFSGDGKRLATACDDWFARLWDPANGTEVKRLDLGGAGTAIAYSFDQTLLCVGMDNGEARLFEVSTGALVRAFRHGSPVLSVAVSPTGKTVATAGRDCAVRIWDAGSGAVAREFVHPDIVTAAVFASTGEHLATACENKVRIWTEFAPMEEIRLVHGDRVTCLAFSADGRRVASGSADGFSSVWDVGSGRLISQIRQTSPVRTIGFAHEDELVITLAGDAACGFVWRDADLIGQACDRMTRNLTREEWTRYMGDRPYRPTNAQLP